MGRVVNTADYTFNKTAKTITFSSKYTGIELAQIQLITDVTNSTVIYQFNKAGYGGTLAGLVLTLAYDTTGAGFNNTDNLMIIVNETQDNTVLYSGTLTTTGSISGIDTTDQQTLSIQVSGSWEGVVMVEGSNDNSFYIPLMVHPVNEFTLLDNINEDGIFNIATSTKFVRLNVVQLITGSINTLILGRTVDGPNAADRLSMAMDRTQNMPLNTQEASPWLRRDINNALIPSDGVTVVNTGARSYALNEVIFSIDTAGYQSLDVIPLAMANQSQFQISNDGVNWVISPPFMVFGQTGVFTNLVSANLLHSIPCRARYIRLIANAGAGVYNITATLKNTPPNFISTNGIQTNIVGTISTTTNISTINGSTPIAASINSSGGQSNVAGITTAGSNTHGSTQVGFPLIVGGRQAPATGYLGGITRIMLMDPAGRVLLGASDQTKSTIVETPLQTISNNFQNGNSLSVTDLSQFEGQSQIELLGQILLEMRITNQYLSELPQKLNAGLNNLDEPTQFRNDPSVFTL